MSRTPPRPRRSRLAAAVAAAAGVLALLAGAPAASAAVRDFPVPTPDAGLHSIATGVDGSLWFTEQKGGKVGRIDLAGNIAEWAVPLDGEFGPEQLTVGRDGRVWVLSDAGKRIFVITPSVPGAPTGGYELSGQLRGDDITTAPDGSIWVSDSLGDGVTRIVGDQVIETAGGAPDCSFDGILSPGPGGRVWCAFKGDALKRIEPDGVNATNFPIPPGNFSVQSLAPGADGNLWYGRYLTATFATSAGNGTVGRMTPTGEVREWPVGDKIAPDGLTAGPDGAMWFTSRGFDGAIGRITGSGALTVTPLGARKATDLAFGGDGALWFVDQNANRVSRLTRDEVTGPPAPTISKANLRAPKNRVSVKVACPKDAAATCRGAVRLRSAAKVRVGRRGARKVRTLTSTGRYAVRPGRSTRVRVRLSSAGRSIVRRGAVRASIQVTPTGAKSVAAKRTVRLRR